MNGSGSGSGSRPSPYWKGFGEGYPKGPQAYVDGRKSTIFDTHDQSEPSSGIATLVSSVGVRPTVALARSAHQGLLSPSEQQQVERSLGETTGTLAGSVTTGMTVGLGLKVLAVVTPPPLKPVIYLAQAGNMLLTFATLATAPQRFNSSLQQNSPAVHAASSTALIALNAQPETVQVDTASMTSMFEHSARQRENGPSSLRGASDIVRVTKPF